MFLAKLFALSLIFFNFSIYSFNEFIKSCLDCFVLIKDFKYVFLIEFRIVLTSKKIFSVINAMVENNKNYTIMSLLMDDGRQLKNILQFVFH